jgi:hypothetical protein
MLLVHPAARAVSGIVDRGAERLAITQVPAEAARAERVLVCARRDAEQLREGPLQVKRACADVRGNRAERECLVGVGRDEVGRFADVIDRGWTRRAAARAAAAAFTKARDLRRVCGREEDHRLALRPPAWTARPAVDARRSHAVDEPAIALRVARENGAPP